MRHIFFLSSIILLVLGVNLPFLISSEAQEREPVARSKQAPKQTDSEQTLKYSRSAAEEYTATPANSWGLGLTTLNVAPFTSIGGFVNATSLTGIINLTREDMIQATLSVPITIIGFNLGVMGLYKRTFMENQYAGFHVGGGLGLGVLNPGSGADFIMSLSALAGVHLRIPSLPRLEAHFDGGPTFYLITTSPSTRTNLQIGALSPALGLSLFYRFD